MMTTHPPTAVDPETVVVGSNPGMTRKITPSLPLNHGK